MTQDQIQKIAAMDSWKRKDYYQQIEREHGKDYAREVKSQVAVLQEANRLTTQEQ